MRERDPSYHGTHEHAVRFALEVHDDTLQTYEFLKAWSEGNLDEWPEFYEWLDQQPGQKLSLDRLYAQLSPFSAYIGRKITHKKRRTSYVVTGVAFVEADMSICFSYTNIGGGVAVHFTRPIGELVDGRWEFW